jgi:hypothetical protein
VSAERNLKERKLLLPQKDDGTPAGYGNIGGFDFYIGPKDSLSLFLWDGLVADHFGDDAWAWELPTDYVENVFQSDQVVINEVADNTDGVGGICGQDWIGPDSLDPNETFFDGSYTIRYTRDVTIDAEFAL